MVARASSLRILVFVLSAGLAGCVTVVGGGDLPPVVDDTPVTLTVTGTVMSYLGGEVVPNADIVTVGLGDAVQAVADDAGLYVLDDVPTATTFFADVSAPLGYRSTRSASVHVLPEELVVPLYAVAEDDVVRQYTSAVGVAATPTLGTAAVFVNLEMSDGTPLVGIPPTAIEVLNDLGEPLLLDPDSQGPFFVGALGDAVPLATEALSAIYDGKAGAVILDLAPGIYSLKVTYLDGLGLTVENISMLYAGADGATLVHSGGLIEAISGAPPAGTFRAEVYPRLQTVAKGGVGCASCHTGIGPLPYDLDVVTVYEALLNTADIVDLDTPVDSLLLQKPLAEVPPDGHPVIFADALNPDYQAILAWITAGAPI